MLQKQYNKKSCKVTFTLPANAAPTATEVRVLGTFNNWNWEKGFPMTLKKDAFVAEVELEGNQVHEFRYLIDNQIWENDWQADDYTITPFGVYNSVVALDGSAIAVKATPAKKEKASAPKAEKAPKAAVKAAAPKATAVKKVTSADDLKKIEGIGPKIEQLLHKDGIVTFNDLATAPIAKVQAVLTAAGPRFKMHNPTTWAEQATLAAAGKWDKLEKLQKALDGGLRK